MEEGEQDKVLTAGTCDDGQGSVHRRGTATGNGGEGAEVFYQQRCAQEGEYLADDVRQQGNGAQVGTAVFCDKDA